MLVAAADLFMMVIPAYIKPIIPNTVNMAPNVRFIFMAVIVFTDTYQKANHL